MPQASISTNTLSTLLQGTPPFLQGPSRIPQPIRRPENEIHVRPIREMLKIENLSVIEEVQFQNSGMVERFFDLKMEQGIAKFIFSLTKFRQ